MNSMSQYLKHFLSKSVTCSVHGAQHFKCSAVSNRYTQHVNYSRFVILIEFFELKGLINRFFVCKEALGNWAGSWHLMISVPLSTGKSNDNQNVVVCYQLSLSSVQPQFWLPSASNLRVNCRRRSALTLLATQKLPLRQQKWALL